MTERERKDSLPGVNDDAELESSAWANEKRLFPGDTSIEKIFFDIAKLVEAQQDADRLLLEYAEKEPKVKKLLNTPQSADKHAEGPKILDHYRCIFTAVKMIEQGLLRAEDIGDSADLHGVEKEWNETLDFVRTHPNLMRAFAIAHDLGKVDYFAVYAKAPAGEAAGFMNKKEFYKKMKTFTPAEREAWQKKYETRYQTFASEHPELTEPDTQKAFFDTHGVTVTYVGHERGAEIPENQAVVERLVKELRLSADEKQLLYFSILHHVSTYLTFENGVADYAALAKLAERVGLDPSTAMRKLQADMMIDGVLGARKREPDIPGLSVAIGSMRKFLEPEKQYAAYLAAEKKWEAAAETERRIKRIAKQTKLDGHGLKDLGFQTDSRFSMLLKAVHESIQTGQLVDFSMYDTVDETVKKTIAYRIQEAREIFQKS